MDKQVKHFDILEDLYLQYEDMEKALEKYCILFGYEIKSKPKKFYELKTESNGIGKYSYYTDLNVPEKEIEAYRNGDYTERFVHLKEITESEYTRNIA